MFIKKLKFYQILILIVFLISIAFIIFSIDKKTTIKRENANLSLTLAKLKYDRYIDAYVICYLANGVCHNPTISNHFFYIDEDAPIRDIKQKIYKSGLFDRVEEIRIDDKKIIVLCFKEENYAEGISHLIFEEIKGSIDSRYLLFDRFLLRNASETKLLERF